jgi:hypothetical protein
LQVLSQSLPQWQPGLRVLPQHLLELQPEPPAHLQPQPE